MVAGAVATAVVGSVTSGRPLAPMWRYGAGRGVLRGKGKQCLACCVAHVCGSATLLYTGSSDFWASVLATATAIGAAMTSVYEWTIKNGCVVDKEPHSKTGHIQEFLLGPAAPRDGDQPLPIPNDSPDIQTLVLEDIRERRKVGVQRYGTALQPHNGRDALRDAYEEALDLVMYLRQAIEERDT